MVNNYPGSRGGYGGERRGKQKFADGLLFCCWRKGSEKTWVLGRFQKNAQHIIVLTFILRKGHVLWSAWKTCHQ